MTALPDAIAVYNSTPPALAPGQAAPFQADATGNLKVNVVAGGGSGSNAAAGQTGAAVPTNAGYDGVNVGGTLVGVTGVTTTLGAAKREIVVDPTTGNGAAVQVFHNADNQALGTAYGLLTGGVAQMVNAVGNLDRQRETGLDSQPALGIVTGAQQSAQAFKGSIAAATTAGTRTVTPSAMSGTTGGVPWSIQVGSILTVDTGTNKENVWVSAVTSTTFTAVFALSHGTNTPFTSFVYNQQRDAAGECDGATGIGTSVAAEYEYNGVGPGGGSFDRARSLQAKLNKSATISAGGGVGSSSLTLSAAPTNLKAGAQVLLVTNTFPAAGQYESAYVDLTYTEGSTTVPLLSATQNSVTYTTMYYDGFGSMGPQLSGFLPIGVGIEEEALYDPVSGMYYIERAATQDGVSAQNVVLETPGLWNGTTIDRQRSVAAAAATTGTGIEACGAMAQYVSSAPTYTNGQYGPARIDANGNLLVSAQAGGLLNKIAASFTRPANTTAYVAGYLVANSTTAGSVTPASFTVVPVAGASFQIQRVRINKTNTSLTNASFRVHLFEASPTVTVGDGAAFNASGVLACNQGLTYLGAAAITMGVSGSDGASGQLALASPIITSPASGTAIYALVEALAAYTPASAETFTITLEGARG